MKDGDTNQVRAAVVEATDGPALQGFVARNARAGATVYTDEARAYQVLPALFYRHKSVQHSVSEYVAKHGSHQQHGELLGHAQRGVSGSITK